jgi:hypothetical protein
VVSQEGLWGMELVSWLVSKCCAKFITKNKFTFFGLLITKNKFTFFGPLIIDLVLFIPCRYHFCLHSTGASVGRGGEANQAYALCQIFDKGKKKVELSLSLTN